MLLKRFLGGILLATRGNKSKKARRDRMELETKIRTIQERVYQTNDTDLNNRFYLLLLRAEYDNLVLGLRPVF